MAKLYGIAGASGSGKTFSLRTLNPAETFFISPTKTQLSFNAKGYKRFDNDTGEGNFVQVADVTVLPTWLDYIDQNRPDIKNLIIEDISHYATGYTLNEGFRQKANGKEQWSRWEEMAARMYQGILQKPRLLRDDLNVITIYHLTTKFGPHGEMAEIKLPGNMLHNQIDIKSYYMVFICTDVLRFDKQNPIPAEERYRFVTQDDGFYPAKTPGGMFDDIYIPNDIAAVIARDREYSTIL